MCWELTIRHGKSSTLVIAPPPCQSRPILLARAIHINLTEPFVHENPAHRSRPRIQVLVITPRGEINVPIMECQLNVSSGVREIPADEDVVSVCMGCYTGDVEELAAVELDARQEDEGEF